MSRREDTPSRGCKEFEQDLVLYHYGECAEPERDRVEKHLQGCSSCQRFLADLRRLLPMTIKRDEPPPVFWQSYSGEMRRKLAATEPKGPWWKGIGALFGPWPVPALATAAVVILALALTFGKRAWRPQDLPPEEEGMMEILPIAENLEFFKNMELLDSLELLEAGAASGNGAA